MLPQRCNPALLASREESLAGTLPVGALDRLVRAVDDAVHPARVSLGFRQDTRGRIRVDGRVEVPVQLTCQRCLESFETNLKASVDVLVVRSEDGAEPGDQDGDTIEIEGDTLPLTELIEDELLLALPMHASHPPGRCTPPAIPRSRDANPDATPPGPLASLAELVHPEPT